MVEDFDLGTVITNTTPLDDKEFFIIKEVLPENGTLGIWGGSKVGKTFFAQNLAMDIALGRDFFGLKIDGKKKVLYVNSEITTKNLRSRFRNIINEKKVDAGTYSIRCLSLKTAPELYDIDEFSKYIIDKYKDQKIGILIIDPIYLFLENENDNKILGHFLKKIAEINSELQCSTILVHHHPKSELSKSTDVINRSSGGGTLGRYIDSAMDLNVIEEEKGTGEKIISVEVGGRHLTKGNLVFKVNFKNGCLFPYVI